MINLLQEKAFYRHAFFDDQNRLHILMPVISGTSIGLDNTCKSALALKDLFGLTKVTASHPNPLSIFDCLNRVKQDLSTDISLLMAEILHRDNELSINNNQKTRIALQQKIARKAQVEAYLELINKIKMNQVNSGQKTASIIDKLNQVYPEYFNGIHKLIGDPNGNAHAILLRPK